MHEGVAQAAILYLPGVSKCNMSQEKAALPEYQLNSLAACMSGSRWTVQVQSMPMLLHTVPMLYMHKATNVQVQQLLKS